VLALGRGEGAELGVAVELLHHEQGLGLERLDLIALMIQARHLMVARPHVLTVMLGLVHEGADQGPREVAEQSRIALEVVAGERALGLLEQGGLEHRADDLARRVIEALVRARRGVLEKLARMLAPVLEEARQRGQALLGARGGGRLGEQSLRAFVPSGLRAGLRERRGGLL
jgi:hypothetical protein